MVSYWSLNDNMSPQVSRTLISILADPNKVVDWIVSTCPLISISCLFINHLRIISNAPIIVGIIVTFMFHSSRDLSFFSLSFNLTLWSAMTAKSIIGKVHFFFFLLSLSLIIWPRLSDLFYLKIPENFMCLILLGGFRFAHIPLVRMVKFKLLAQFPVDRLPHLVVSYTLFALICSIRL